MLPLEISIDCAISVDTLNNQPIASLDTMPIRTWDLHKLGVGGMKDVAEQLFRRAFASRLHPLATVQRLGVKHVKGVLLYGCPGTGKTLIARAIAGLLSKNRAPKIVSGPEIFNKYIGESQKNIRNLFEEAEQEQLTRGDHSDLHVVIFDEFDSIGRKRSENDDSSSAVVSQIVNQLLAKMDGVEQLNNILIIALTNRKDILDPALLRPGRFEIQIEVTLPSLEDRVEIFEIHCAGLLENGCLSHEVSLQTLAEQTVNYSGAEIEGLVKSAVSYALSRAITINCDSQIVCDRTSELRVTLTDFDAAFTEVYPQYGIQKHNLFNGTDDIGDTSLISQFRNPFQTMLVNTTKSQLVVSCLRRLGVACMMCVDYYDLIGLTETEKCKHLKNVYTEASTTNEAIIVLDQMDAMIASGSTALIQSILTLSRYFPHIKTVAISREPKPHKDITFDTTILL